MRRLMCVGLLFASLIAGSAQAMTASEAFLEWTPTADATIRYELRWKHFANDWAWQPIASNLDSTTGAYTHRFPVLPETSGDRGACWDVRAVRGGLVSPWLSDSGQQSCLQVPITAPIPVPVPLPTPVPVPPATISMSGDTITIQCDKTRFTRMKTVGTGTKRTITCLR